MARTARSDLKTQREQTILREVVESYIDSGAAVGSKTIAQRLKGELSSASIRAVMLALDRQGLLSQPHTSSGRVPTDRGYRAYLDQGVEPSRPSTADRQHIACLGWAEGESEVDVLRSAVVLLARRMGLAGVLVAPRVEQAVLQAITFVWLRTGTVLAVAVTRSGMVHERVLAIDPSVGRFELERFANYLNTVLPGRTLVEVREQLRQEQRRDEEALGELERQARELGRMALSDAEGAEVLVEGAADMLEATQVEDPKRVAELVRWLERREAWLTILTRTIVAEDTQVYVGAEVGADSVDTCSLVAAGYQAPAGVGVIALVGPKRLDYRRAIPLVSGLARRLTALLLPPESRPS